MINGTDHHAEPAQPYARLVLRPGPGPGTLHAVLTSLDHTLSMVCAEVERELMEHLWLGMREPARRWEISVPLYPADKCPHFPTGTHRKADS